MAGALEINLEFPIDKYDRMEILGYGAYGTVYLYKQRRDDISDELLPAKELVPPNFIAVKTFGSEHYFQIEKKNLDMISSKGQEHPNLVKIYGWCKLPNYIFGIVMEKFDTNLKLFIHDQRLKNKSIDLDMTRNILHQLAKALKFLVEKNIVHRDLKPENILIRNADNNIQVAITDLGVSRMITNTEKSNMTYEGTNQWMAPEVQECGSTYGHPADVFSFGLIAMFIKAGANPINKNDSSTEKYEEWIHKKERFLEDDQLIDLIKQCLMHNPKQRPRKENLIYHNFFQPNCSTDQLLPKPEYSFDVEPLPIATSSSTKKKKMIAGMIVTLILAVSLVSMTIIFAPQTIEVPLPTRNITFPKNKRFLILGGLTSGSNLETEVIDVNSSSSPFGAIPSKRSLAVGGLLDSTPILCGGFNPYEDSCITFKNSQWTKTHEMTTKRGLAASVQLNSTTLWILGGRKADQDYLDSTEFIRADSSFGLQGPKLPKAMHSFCVIKYSEQQVFIIGGRRGNERLNTVYILNPMDDFNYIYGPPLKNSRGDHACGLMSNGQQSKIVVAGGSSKYVDFFFISSVEIFDPTVNNWITGPSLPYELGLSAMATSPSGGGVILFGGYNGDKKAKEDTILELRLGVNEWTQLPQTLNQSRHKHVVIPIP